ncbi:hypothetical protein INR49_001207 [Caranx melampygus]|nr:hypothetical protein INR49_001207 [Caranx melampygus]
MLLQSNPSCKNTLIDFDEDRDYAILELNPDSLNFINNNKKVELPPGLLKNFGPMPQYGNACIIGHPGGGGKKMDPTYIIEEKDRLQVINDHLRPYKDDLFTAHSIIQKITKQGIEHILQDGALEEYVVTYKTFMRHGSSGSPVFDSSGQELVTITRSFGFESREEWMHVSRSRLAPPPASQEEVKRLSKLQDGSCLSSSCWVDLAKLLGKDTLIDFEESRDYAILELNPEGHNYNNQHIKTEVPPGLLRNFGPVPQSVVLLSSQSIAETPPELPPPLLLLRPLQIRGGAHEFAKFAEAFGDVICGQRLQQDQDGWLSTRVPIKNPEVGEVQLVATPVGLDKILREDKDGPSAALHGAHDVVHDPVSGEKVSLVETQGQRPGGCVTRRIFICLPELAPAGAMLGLQPRPRHLEVPDGVKTPQQDAYQNPDKQRHPTAQGHKQNLVAHGKGEVDLTHRFALQVEGGVTDVALFFVC